MDMEAGITRESLIDPLIRPMGIRFIRKFRIKASCLYKVKLQYKDNMKYKITFQLTNRKNIVESMPKFRE